MLRTKGENKMALDFSAFEVDCRSMGGLFQQLSHEMKNTSSVWQDFISKANKFHSSLGIMSTAMTSFLDSFQKIADMANNSKGAVRDIGGSLTKLCLRQRSVEAKLKEFITILGGTFSPIPGLLDDWKKTVVQMDHAHAKEYKKLNNEIQKNLNDANKLKKQVEKGGRAEKLQPSLDSKMKAVEWKYSDLATNECVSLKKLTLHERQRFSFFVRCLSPLLEKQSEIFTEAATLEEMKKILLEQTSDSDNIIKYCEDFVDEFRASKSGRQQEQQLNFVTPPGTPRSLTRHSSSLSIRSSNSALNKRPHSQLNRQEHGDGQSLISNSASTTGAFETDSMLSQDTLTRDQSTRPANSPANNSTASTIINNSSPSNDNKNIFNEPTIGLPLSTSFTTFGADRRSFTNSHDSLARKKQNKPTQLNPSEVEDAELMLAHRSDPNRFFNRGMGVRNSVAVPSRYQQQQQAAVQALDSPVRPGRKNDKRATIEYSNVPRHDSGPQNFMYGSSAYATLGRSSFKSGSVKANFYGGNYSTGKIGHNVPTCPPPPPPPLPSSHNTANHNIVNHNLQSPTNEQYEALLRSSSKKASAPLPPTQTTSSFPTPSEVHGRTSSFSYTPQFSLVSPTTQNAQNNLNTSKQRHPLNVTIPYYKSQPSPGDKPVVPSSAKLNATPLETPIDTPEKRSESPTLSIRIFRKYPEGLVTPPASKNVNLEISAPPKPPPPARNSSMAADQSASNPESEAKRQLSRTPSFKQQSAPKDCPPLTRAAPLTIGDKNTNNNNNINDNGNGNSLDAKNNNDKSTSTGLK